MKKYSVLLIILLTGCVTNMDFSKTCNYEYKTTHLNDKTSITVIYDSDDVINEAIIVHSYKALDEDGLKTISNIKNSINKYNDEDVFVYVSKDSKYEYEIKYKLDVQRLDSSVLKEFKLNKSSIKFFNKMRKENIECEVN